jgi:hypothetical protein
VCVEEITPDEGGPKEQGIIFLSIENVAKIVNLEQDFCTPQDYFSI